MWLGGVMMDDVDNVLRVGVSRADESTTSVLRAIGLR